MIGQCTEEDLCIAKYDQEYFDQLAQDAQQQLLLNLDLNKFIKYNRWYLPKIIIIISILIIFIAAFIYVYQMKINKNSKYKSIPSSKSSYSHYYDEKCENTPLLIN